MPLPTFPEALQLLLEWSQPLERVVLATWSRYDVWQLDLDLEAHGLPRLAVPVPRCQEAHCEPRRAESFEETARALAPDSVRNPAPPRHGRCASDCTNTEPPAPSPFLTGGSRHPAMYGKIAAVL